MMTTRRRVTERVSAPRSSAISVTRRRVVIILAALVVSAYAAGVLAYTISTPEVGIRPDFAREPLVSKLYSEFVYLDSQKGPLTGGLTEGDQILYLGDHRIKSWSQFLRRLAELKHEKPDTLDPDTTEADLLVGSGG